MFDLTKATSLKPIIRDASRSGSVQLYHEAQSRNLSLSEYLEELDPSPRTADGKITVPLDAFERQLAVHDIRIGGRNALSVEQFLMSDASILAPEFIVREIKYGMTLRQDPSELCGVMVSEQGPAVKPLYFKTETVQKPLAEHGEGAAFPVVTVGYREKSAYMVDRGRQFDFPYRVIRNQKLTEFRTLLWAIGAQMAEDEVNEIYRILRRGDGTSGEPPNVFNGNPGELTYADLVHLTLSFKVPSHMTHLLCSPEDLEKILNLPQFQDPMVWRDAQSFSKVGDYQALSPFGSKLVRVDGAEVTEMIAMDKRFAIREAVAQPLLVEAEKIINAKMESAVVSKESVYTLMLEDAVKLCDY
ncbi:MAG: hypothetical protein N2450_07855 [bacterium]|nr:hypothetical protein [bacterium]